MPSTDESTKPESYQHENGSFDKEMQLANREERPKLVTNEYVLNVAFWTFLGFLLAEAVFAVIANSRSMLEDAEAMSVDALTYLFNLCAERIKHRPFSEKELQMPPEVREYKREILRLYLELIPPLISVSTLIVVTVYSMRDALESMNGNSDGDEDDVDVAIMMYFSAGNLLLDVVNVYCFARAHQAFGLTRVHRDVAQTRFSIRGDPLETEGLLHVRPDFDDEPEERELGAGEQLLVNLNMCSAWTHVCADTMRSVSVLIAAMASYFFNDLLPGEMADSLATIVVSIIILISLIPLLHGLVIISRKIVALSTDPRRPTF